MNAKNTMDKDAMKQLREARRVWVENARQSTKTQNQIISQIKTQLADAAKTVPEIAQAAGMPASQVLLYIAGLKKYGQVAEAEKDGDYFKYRLTS